MFSKRYIDEDKIKFIRIYSLIKACIKNNIGTIDSEKGALL
jgi:hypothetical protein